MAACAAILLFGLPHGALDLRMLVARTPVTRLAAYLGLAALTFLLWRLAPIAALAAFLALAIIHFAGDWTALDEPFLAHGIAAGLISAPSLLHLETLRALFAALAGHGDAAALGDVLRLLAPMALALAVAGVLALVVRGHGRLALATATALIAMVLLPPAVGFALYFGLLHSPLQLSAELPTSAEARRKLLLRVVLPVTAMALAIALGLALTETRPTASASVVAGTFMALSILTTPHMIAPAVIRRLSQAKNRGGRPKRRVQLRSACPVISQDEGEVAHEASPSRRSGCLSKAT